MTETDAIMTSGLLRRYGQHSAVDGLDLRIRAGEIYGFLGPNGAGKTTVVRMLCTLLRPTSGHARVAGFDVVTQAKAVRLRIGAALQEVALDAGQSGRELLRLQGRLYGLRGRELSDRVNQVLDLVDLGSAIDKRIATYSGGMKRRLDLAAALVHNPEVVFLDEPTTGLDPISRRAVWQEVRRLNQQLGTTIFLTTQYLDEADELAHRVGIIDRGRLVVEGSPSELKRAIGRDLIAADVEADPVAAVRMLSQRSDLDSITATDDRIMITSRDGAAVLSAVALALNDAGVPVRSLTLRTPTLDDVFLQLTGSHIETNS